MAEAALKPGAVWLASFLAYPLAGWPLLAHAGYRRFSAACRIGLATAVGAVLISFWMTVFALGRWAWRPLPLLLLGAATGAALRWILPRAAARQPEASGPPPRLFEKLALAVAAGAVLWAFVAAFSGAATSTDYIFLWAPKAQDFASVRTIDAGFLNDLTLLYLHRSYPPLVTNLLAYASVVAGRFAWGTGILTFPLFLGALALALPGLLRRAASPRAAWACAATIVSAYGFLGSHLRVAGNGEPFLWLFETLAMAILVGPFASEPGGQLLAGLLLAGAAAAKIEGLPFAVAAIALFLLVAGRAAIRRPVTLLLLVLPTLLTLGVWFAFGAARHLFVTYESYGSVFVSHWSRLPAVLAGIGREIWSGAFALPYLAPLAALLLAPGKTRRALVQIGTTAALSLFFLFTYLNHETDPSQFINWSAGRVFSPITAFLAIASLAHRDG